MWILPQHSLLKSHTRPCYLHLYPSFNSYFRKTDLLCARPRCSNSWPWLHLHPTPLSPIHPPRQEAETLLPRRTWLVKGERRKCQTVPPSVIRTGGMCPTPQTWLLSVCGRVSTLHDCTHVCNWEPGRPVLVVRGQSQTRKFQTAADTAPRKQKQHLCGRCCSCRRGPTVWGEPEVTPVAVPLLGPPWQGQ